MILAVGASLRIVRGVGERLCTFELAGPKATSGPLLCRVGLAVGAAASVGSIERLA